MNRWFNVTTRMLTPLALIFNPEQGKTPYSTQGERCFGRHRVGGDTKMNLSRGEPTRNRWLLWLQRSRL